MSMTIGTDGFWRYWMRRDRLRDAQGKDLPAEKQDPKRPHFRMRRLTGRQQRQLAEALDQIEAHPKDGASAEYVDKCLAAGAAAGPAAWLPEGEGGRVVELDKGIDDLAGLGYREAAELAYAGFAGELTAADLGNSDSQPSTAGDSSASPEAAPA